MPARHLPYDADRPVWRVRDTVLAAVPRVALLAAVVALGFLSGGYIFTLAAPVVLVLGGFGITWLWVRRGGTRLPRAYRVGLIGLGAFAVWAGLSVLWSVGPDLSWIAFDFALLYFFVAWFAAIVPAGAGQLRVVAYGYAGAIAAIAVYALLGKIAPDVVTHAHTYARLSAPIGYWNVLAVIIAMAFPIALEAAARRGAPLVVRGVAASTLVLYGFTLFFTFSRGGFLTLGVVLLVYFVLSTSRLSSLISLVISVAPTAAALYHVRGLSTLFNATTDDALRTAQGHALARWVVVALIVAFVAQAAVALVHRRLRLPQRAVQAVGAAVLLLIVAGLVVFSLWYFPRHGGFTGWVKAHYEAIMHESADTGNGASRLLVVSTSGRIDLYREALKGFAHHEAIGAGAGTFRFTNLLYRTQPWIVKHAHSEWLNVLDELGIVGLALFVVGIGGLLAASLRGLLRDRRDPQRSLLAACQGAVLGFVVHMSVDWDWDMAAATVGFLLLAGVATAYVRQRGVAAARAHDPQVAVSPAAEAAAEVGNDSSVDDRGEASGQGSGASMASAPRSIDALAAAEPVSQRRSLRSLSGRVVVTGAVVLALASWTVPYLAERAASAAVDEAGRQQLAAAAASARRASRLDPLAVDPLVTLALVQEQQGRGHAAQATLMKALRLQPRNYEIYYQMGLLELNVFGRKRVAAEWFARALALNPLDSMTRYQLSIAEAR